MNKGVAISLASILSLATFNGYADATKDTVRLMTDAESKEQWKRDIQYVLDGKGVLVCKDKAGDKSTISGSLAHHFKNFSYSRYNKTAEVKCMFDHRERSQAAFM